jgi:hypothetical protein
VRKNLFFYINIENSMSSLFSELNSNDPIQSTHLLSRYEVEIQLTNRKTLLNETTPTNDVNQVCRIVFNTR